MPAETVFPEATTLRMPLGTLAKVKGLALARGCSCAELLRQAVRREVQGCQPDHACNCKPPRKGRG